MPLVLVEPGFPPRPYRFLFEPRADIAGFSTAGMAPGAARDARVAPFSSIGLSLVVQCRPFHLLVFPFSPFWSILGNKRPKRMDPRDPSKWNGGENDPWRSPFMAQQFFPFLGGTFPPPPFPWGRGMSRGETGRSGEARERTALPAGLRPKARELLGRGWGSHPSGCFLGSPCQHVFAFLLVLVERLKSNHLTAKI